MEAKLRQYSTKKLPDRSRAVIKIMQSGNYEITTRKELFAVEHVTLNIKRENRLSHFLGSLLLLGYESARVRNIYGRAIVRGERTSDSINTVSYLYVEAALFNPKDFRFAYYSIAAYTAL